MSRRRHNLPPQSCVENGGQNSSLRHEQKVYFREIVEVHLASESSAERIPWQQKFSAGRKDSHWIVVFCATHTI